MSMEDPGDTPLPEGEAVVDTPADDDAPETGKEQAPDEAEQKQSEEPKRRPWFQERIDQLTREKYEERRQRESVEARLADTLADPEKARANPSVNIEAEVNARLAARQFDDKCNEVYSSGKSEYNDFDTTLQNFTMLGGLPQPLLEAVTQLPDAHKVLYALGQNMDETARILSLAPIPMAMALARLSASPTKARPVSNAPPPIKPITGSSRSVSDPEDMNTEEWMKWRETQLKD